MTEQFKSVPARPGRGGHPRTMILTFAAGRQIRTTRGEIRADELQPGDRLLSGQSGGMTVFSATECDDFGPAGHRAVVRVIVGQPVGSSVPEKAVPVAGRVSPHDGRLHLSAPASGIRPH
ncbi:hypothetical protein [Tropicimonas sp. IMCC34043]|uniref:hypothetical protein n=1 Tax=Tropicimonas sp. IMCC34043 TaxID=2248760 RepID=UPI000E285F01|nr:hypothetical protein [Tropicimonas sp. IMCC34043]